MDGLSAAASAFGVVSLAVQLIQLTQNLRDFFNDVSGAPSEIRRLTESLQQLDIILRDVQGVTEMQHAQEGAPSAPLSLLASLKACEEKLLVLKKIVDSSEQRLRASGKLSKHWESFKVVFKKKDIERFGEHLHQAIQYLTTAMTMNLMVISLEMTTSIAHISQHPSLLGPPSAEASSQLPFDTNDNHSTAISRHITISRSIDHFQLPFRSQLLNTTYTRKTKTRQSRRKLDDQDRVHVKEHILCISSTMLGYYISLCFKNAFSSISHSLQVDPIADSNAPIFKLCEAGDITGVQDMFARQLVSPFVRNPNGLTLLHYAAWYGHANLITLLLDYSVDANKTDHIIN